MKKISCFVVIVLTIAFYGCQKEPGVGGDASIHGKIIRMHYNSTFTVLLDSSAFPDKYVYIIYGNNINYGQRLKTSYKGEFEFKHLYEGNYQIYTYTIDSLAKVKGAISPPDTVVTAEVNIKERKQVIDVGNLIVYN